MLDIPTHMRHNSLTPPTSKLLLGAALLVLLGGGCAPLPRQAPSESQSAATPVTTTAATPEARAKSEILSQKDFDGSGLASRKPDSHEDTFRVQINPKIPPYTFHVTSETSSSTASIEIFRDTSSTKPIQTIQLNPSSWLADMLPLFFSVQDVNFDGYADIGIPFEGGAKWSAYRYWAYAPKSGTFVETPTTRDLQKIRFNYISYKALNKQVTADILEEAGWRELYQFKNNRYILLKEERFNNLIQSDANESTEHPTLHCSITTIQYSNGTSHTTTTEQPRECDNSMRTIPFDYPEADKSLFQ